ncbi:MAG: bacteriohopanetetrol glucosamine biosynthesis glycosyltransferase HpnI, partial [Acidobacteria bacterium]|nr:bacteriohopanetetrol glucosamine biosynthesis glycosyltransferase HpnI [Acidobacteriota bacterium]
VSVLKPVRGLDRHFYECVRSHAAQDYPEFELLFAVRDPNDPAIGEIRRLAAEFSQRRIEVFLTERDLGPNAKVNGLERLRPECRYPVLVDDDSDIRVGPDWLRRVVAPLADPRVGLVTCPYRGAPDGGWPSLLEALWISTDFQASVLVARLLGMRFALGATMVFRREQLEQAGGFAPLAPYLADDYLLGKAIHDRGFEIELSDCVVETMLPPDRWRASWRHRLRWARTVRACRPGGTAGVLVTFVIPLSLVALAVAPAAWPLAAASVVLRLAVAWAVGCSLLRDPVAARYFLLIPIADVASFLVWAGGFWGRHVAWRGEHFRLERGGRLRPLP